MALTMWRGNDLLGELRLLSWGCESTADGPGKPWWCAAALVRAPGAPECERVSQVAFGRDVMQPRVESHRAEQSRPTRGGITFALKPVPPEDLVPPEKQFTVRDASGKAYLPEYLFLDEMVMITFASVADSPGYAMAPPVTIAALVEGMQMQSDARDSYLHRPTGSVVSVSHDAFEAVERGDQAGCSAQDLRLAKEILHTEGQYLALPGRFAVDEKCGLQGEADVDECYRQAAFEWCAENGVESASGG